MAKTFTVYGLDIGASGTKILQLRGDGDGRIYPAGGSLEPTVISTPKPTDLDIRKPDQHRLFIPRLEQYLQKAGQLPQDKPADCLIGYAFCGPVTHDLPDYPGMVECGPAVNLGLEPVLLKSNAWRIVNDGDAHTDGSWRAGVGQGQRLCSFLNIGLGTGVSLGAFVRQPKGRGFAFLSPEAHGVIPGGITICNCGATSCWESNINTQALRRHLDLAGSPSSIFESENVADACLADINHPKVIEGLEQWSGRIALGLTHLCNLFQGQDLLIAFSGGLAPLIDRDLLRYQLCNLYGGDPFFLRRRTLRMEIERNGHITACIGAATNALADRLGCDITEISFYSQKPAV